MNLNQCAMVFVTTFTVLKNRITILLCLVFAFSKTANAQKTDLPNAWVKATHFEFSTTSGHVSYQPPIRYSCWGPTPAMPPKVTSISDYFYVEHLPFVCKAEWQMQKTVKLPLVFRLGDVNFVNFLEDKPNSVWGR
jgi:hypothetical protein